MDLKFKIYFTEVLTDTITNILCATCAIKKVINDDRIVDIKINEYNEEYSMMNYNCSVCNRYIETQNL